MTALSEEREPSRGRDVPVRAEATERQKQELHYRQLGSEVPE